jgi:ADP-ribosyl-[dinitrogen reductase] hydrolase
MDIRMRSRVRGAIVGTAIGDALGMPLEGLRPAIVAKVYGRVSGFVAPKIGTWAERAHKLSRGQWTDDTQLMLAIGESVVTKGGLDFNDIANRHILAMKSDPRGWGGTTIAGFTKISAGVAWWNSARAGGAGNGTPMKIAPIGVMLGLGLIDDFEAVSAIINISRMSHGDPRPAVAGILQARMIADGIRGGWPMLRQRSLHTLEEEAEALDRTFGSPPPGIGFMIRTGRLSVGECWGNAAVKRLGRDVGTGCFVIHSFPFVCGALRVMGDDPRACLEEIVNLGGDADTTGAMAGAVLGAAHGMSAFPAAWRKPLEGYARLVKLADSLCDMPTVHGGLDAHRPKIMFSQKGAPSKEPGAMIGGEAA